MNPIVLSNDEYIAVLRTCKVLEGLAGDVRVPPGWRQFANDIRVALGKMMTLLTVEESENEAQVVGGSVRINPQRVEWRTSGDARDSKWKEANASATERDYQKGDARP